MGQNALGIRIKGYENFVIVFRRREHLIDWVCVFAGLVINVRNQKL